MGLVKDKKYPAYYTYEGTAYNGRTAFHSFRFPYLDDIIEWVTTKAVEAQVWANGGEMLELKIWIYDSSWHGIPTYYWIVEWSYYIPSLALDQVTLGWATVFYAVIALLTIIALVFMFKQIKEIIWGPGGEIPPEGETIFDKLSKAIMWGGLAFAGAYLIVHKLQE